MLVVNLRLECALFDLLLGPDPASDLPFSPPLFGLLAKPSIQINSSCSRPLSTLKHQSGLGVNVGMKRLKVLSRGVLEVCVFLMPVQGEKVKASVEGGDIMG